MTSTVTVRTRTDSVTVLETPAGPLTIVWNGDAVVSAGFTADLDRLDETADPVAPLPDTVVETVSRFFDGAPDAIDDVPVAQKGTPVQEAVWTALRTIPPGTVVSYGEVADMIGRPRAARAVGSACGSNHAALFVPCHRVVRADGSLGGYGWGLDVKEVLLTAERAV